MNEDRLSKDILPDKFPALKFSKYVLLKRFDPSLATLPDFILELKSRIRGNEIPFQPKHH